MRLILFLLFPIFLSGQINRAYGVIEIGATFPTSSSTGPKFAYRTVDSSFYRWVSGSTWVKIIPDGSSGDTLYLKQLSGTTALVNGDTIDISTYLLHSDTASMLDPYIKLAGYGLSKLVSHTLQADTSSPNGLATRLFTKTLPTSIIADRSIRSNGSNLVVGNFTDNGTKVQALLPFQLHQWTTAGRPTGVTGYEGYNTTGNGKEWYQGSRWAYALESTAPTFTANRIIYTDANGQATASPGLNFTSATGLNVSETGVTQDYLLDLSGTTTSNSSTSLGGLRINGGFTYSTGTNPPAYGILVDPTFTGSFGGGTAGLYITAKSAYSGFGSAGIRINTSSSNGIYITGSSNRALIELNPTTSGTRSIYGIAAADNIYGNIAFIRNTTNLNTGVGMRFATLYTGSGHSDLSHNYEIGSVLTEYSGTIGRNSLVFRSTQNSVTTERARLTDLGFFGIGTPSPLQELDVNGDAYIRDSTRLTTTPAHSAITGLLTRNTDGWVGAASLAGGLSYSGGVLTGANIYNADGNLGNNVTRTFGMGSNGDAIEYRTDVANKMHKTYLSIPTGSADYDDEARVLYQNGGTKTRNINHYKAVGIYEGASNYTATYLNSVRTASDLYSSNELYSQTGSGTTANFANAVVATDSTNASSISAFKITTENSASPKSHWAGLIDGSYGNGGWGNFTARMISYSPSFLVQTTAYNSNTYFNWLAIKNLNAADTATTDAIEFYNGDYTWKNGRPGTGSNVHVWDNGTPSFKEIKRDTTIFVTADTDYDFSAAVTTAQIASRYNRIIIHMTLTSGVGADKTTTLHAPDANLMQCEILIRGTDNTGSYDNEINFGTNNAISSDGTNASGYTLAQGQGLHVRVVYNGSAYKYIYY